MKHYPITKTLVATLTAATFVAASVQPVRAQDEGAGEQTVGVVRLTPEVRNSITKGLDYLAKEGLQKADGSWGSGQNDVAETSAALMAFMLKGYIPGRGGRYGVVMENGLTYLINKGKAQRGFLGTPNNHAGMYEHGLAVLALSDICRNWRKMRCELAVKCGSQVSGKDPVDCGLCGRLCHLFYAQLYDQLGTSNCTPEANTPQASGECVVQMIVLRT